MANLHKETLMAKIEVSGPANSLAGHDQIHSHLADDFAKRGVRGRTGANRMRYTGEDFVCCVFCC